MPRVNARFPIIVNRNIFAAGLDPPTGLNRLTKLVFRSTRFRRLKWLSGEPPLAECELIRLSRANRLASPFTKPDELERLDVGCGTRFMGSFKSGAAPA